MQCAKARFLVISVPKPLVSNRHVMAAQVQDALRQFLTPPDETSWQDAPDDAVDSLLAAVDTLCKLAVSSG